MLKKIALATLIALAACTAPYDLPAEDRSAIAQRIAGFERAFVTGNTTRVINVIPPRLITALAAEAGVAERELRREMAALTRQVTANVDIISFDMALDQARFLTTPSGRPYGLIPTRTIVQTAGGTKLQSDETTLTLEDGGKWYLVRIDEGRQFELMRETYPDFKNVSFPKGTTKVIG